MPLADVDTPALVLDLDAFERNLAALPRRLAGSKVQLRPHSKTHKSPVIALRQIAHGAVGVCCQKVSEAEVLHAGGVQDILIANEVVGRQKLRRLAALACSAKIAVCVDHADNVEQLETAAAEFGATITVLIEIDVGANRCGVAPGAPAVELARRIVAMPHLRFDGLQAYHGSAQHLRAHDDRRRAIEQAAASAAATRAAIEAAGIACPRITGAGTGTFAFEAHSGVYTELQCGSYVFMDADYGRNLDAEGMARAPFEHSLFVWATVMSRPSRERAVVDAGLKAFSVDSGMPLLPDHPGAILTRASDEHGRIDLGDEIPGLELGDKVRLVPGHCDPTVNLHDWYVCVRAGRVEALWPVAARGALS